MKISFATFLVLITCSLIVVAGYSAYRDWKIEQLYKAATGQTFQSFTNPKAAVQRLAGYSGKHSSRRLIDIALAKGPSVSWTSDAQVEAIKALGQSGSIDAAIAISSLLQPHNGLNVREAVAESLQLLPCTEECIRGVTYYLERVWRGDMNFEDTLILARTDPRLSSEKEQAILYGNLHSVLSREKPETLKVMRDVYGFGSPIPSPFALDLVAKLRLQETCPLLLQSDKLIQQERADLFAAPRQEIKAALTSLQCQ